MVKKIRKNPPFPPHPRAIPQPQNKHPMKYFLILIILFSCNRPVFKERWLKEKAPAHFTARFETSQGNIDAEFTREWSPLAVDRFYTQIKHHVYDHTLFYRVVPKFVAQYGTDDSAKEQAWKNTASLMNLLCRETNAAPSLSRAVVKIRVAYTCISILETIPGSIRSAQEE
jgi:hypothetical protein